MRTLDRLSKIIMAVGGIISATAMCCLDSEGVYILCRSGVHHGRVRDWCWVWAATVEQAQAGKARSVFLHGSQAGLAGCGVYRN